MTEKRDIRQVESLLRDSLAGKPDEEFVQQVMQAVMVDEAASNRRRAQLRFLPGVLGLAGFCLSSWVFFDYSLLPLISTDLSGLIAMIMDANTAAWTLAAVLLGSGLWVFTELE